MISVTRSCRLLALVALIAAGAAAVLSVAAQPAPAAAYKRCGLTESEQQPKGGVPTYNLSVKEQRTTCTTAKKVAKAFHKCRATSGYVCTKRVLVHWTCKGKKDSSTPVLFYGSFTCTWGPRRVHSSYQQNT